MKKRTFLILGASCLLVLYSCTNDVENNATESSKLSTEQLLSKNSNGKKPESGFFDPAGLISPSAKGTVSIIQDGFNFTEGPAVDRHGNVFFTDQPNDRIYKWSASTGNVSLFLEGTGRSNGMAFDKDGNLIACADMYGELWKIYPDGSHDVLIDNYNGKLLNGPNDVWINPVTGGMYITDPIFPRGNYWEADDPRLVGNPNWPPTHSEQAETGKGGHVYYLAPGATELVRVTTMEGWDADIWPNGIVGTPDGKKLYINQWTGGPTGNIWSFDINEDGTLSNLATFVSGLQGSDGMSMDEQGNVYVSSGGIKAFDPSGNKVLEINNSGGSTNNVFAGQNNKELFITSANYISTIKMNVKGVEKFKP